MRLFNQTQNALKWDMSGVVYECDPYGSLVVEDHFVPAVLARGVPLAVTPVPPEVKAHQRVANVQAEISGKERAETEAKLAALTTEVVALKRQLEDQASELASAGTREVKATAALAASKDEVRSVRAELTAAEATLAAQAGSDNDEARALTARIVDLTAAEAGIRDELTAVRQALANQRELAAAKDAELISLSAVHANVLTDKKALEELLEETAARANDFEKRATTAEQRLEEQRAKRDKRATG